MSRLSCSLVLAGIVSLSACADPALEKRVTDLEAQVKDVNTKIEELKAAPPAAAKGGDAGPAVDPVREQAATDLYRLANEASEAGKYEEAKAKLAELSAQYSDTRAAKRASRLAAELAVVGVEAGELKGDKWFSKNQTTMSEGQATYLVFFEEWCPHCQREVPKLEETYDKFKGQGLNVVAITKVSRGATDEKVQTFLDSNNVSYPVLKETGDLSQRFGVQGIPAAAVVVDGKVVWRGHPARVTDEMIQGWIKG